MELHFAFILASLTHRWLLYWNSSAASQFAGMLLYAEGFHLKLLKCCRNNFKMKRSKMIWGRLGPAADGNGPRKERTCERRRSTLFVRSDRRGKLIRRLASAEELGIERESFFFNVHEDVNKAEPNQWNSVCNLGALPKGKRLCAWWLNTNVWNHRAIGASWEE